MKKFFQKKKEKIIKKLSPETLAEALANVELTKSQPPVKKRCHIHYCKLSDEEHKSITDRHKLWLLASVRQHPPPPKRFRPPPQPRKLKIDHSEEENDYREVFCKSKRVNMNTVFELNIYFSERTGRSLKEKIYDVMHEGYFRVLKKDDKESRIAKKNFFELVKDCRDWPRLNILRRRAVKQGLRVSVMLLDIMFMMSQNKRSEIGAKFQAFGDALEYVSKDEETVVISKILELIKAVEIQLRWKRKTLGIEDEDLVESFIDVFMFKLLACVLYLEFFWVLVRFPRDRSLYADELLASAEHKISRWQLKLMEMEDRLKAAAADGKFGTLPRFWKASDGYTRMEFKIDDLWRDLND